MDKTQAKSVEQRVLVLAPTGRDAVLTEGLLRDAGLAVQVCADMEQMCAELQRDAGAVVLAEEALDPAAARKLVETLESQAAWSDPPLIVLTGRGTVEATQRMAAGLGEHTSLTLLERPLRSVTLLSAVHSALRARSRQYEVRDLLVRLEKGVHERDRFLATLSHELRNPLATILGVMSLTEQADTKSGFDDEERQIVIRQARHLARLIDDLLDISRVTEGKIVLHEIVVDLNDVAHRSIQAVQPMARAQHHELTATTSPGAVYVRGDPTRLEQIFTNLLNNAIKYTPPGGHISLALGPQGKEARLLVRDDGIGITPESLPLIFEPFVQVDESIDRAQGGLGLGLSLVRRLVEMHGGRVAAESAGLGKGSAFTVSLPLTEPLAAEKKREMENLPRLTRRVLVIEDHVDAQRVMQRLLRLWGHSVEVASNGPEGVAKALSLRPDVAFVDLGLPGIDGYAVARQIRANLDGQIFLVALTGYGQPEDRQRTQAAGFDVHLVKPVEPDILRRLLDQPLPGRTTVKPV